jgi:succinate dehydrogenase / fumarate reductase cytochrome b subunit
MSTIFASSIGKKLMVALAGLFLILFLLVHLGINLTLILTESSKPFNVAAHFMGTNIIIKIFEVILFAAFLLHIIYVLILQIQNWLARPKRYKIPNYSQLSFFSKFMIWLGGIILIFLVIHLTDFYFKSKFGHIEEITYDNTRYYDDLSSMVMQKFQIPGFVIFYIACFLILGFHLWHGFQSVFQTLGLNHKVYTPVIKKLGRVYTIVVISGFTIIPLVIHFTH